LLEEERKTKLKGFMETDRQKLWAIQVLRSKYMYLKRHYQF